MGVAWPDEHTLVLTHSPHASVHLVRNSIDMRRHFSQLFVHVLLHQLCTVETVDNLVRVHSWEDRADVGLCVCVFVYMCMYVCVCVGVWREERNLKTDRKHITQTNLRRLMIKNGLNMQESSPSFNILQVCSLVSATVGMALKSTTCLVLMYSCPCANRRS